MSRGRRVAVLAGVLLALSAPGASAYACQGTDALDDMDVDQLEQVDADQMVDCELGNLLAIIRG